MRPRHLLTAPAAALLSLAALALVPGPAPAETGRVVDAVGDVSRDSSGRPVPRGADGESSVDVRSVTLAHGARRVRMVVQVRDLRPEERGRPSATGFLRASDGTVYRFYESSEAGGAHYGVVEERVDDHGFIPLDCDVDARRSPLRDRLSFGFARSCLDDPRWLRSGVSTYTVSEDWPGGVVDDARRRGGFRGEYAGSGARIGGPRVYAGSRG